MPSVPNHLRLALAAACLLLFANLPRVAPAQIKLEVRDCPTAPTAVPRGNIPKSISDCAIQHAQFLYAHRCVGQPTCSVVNATVTAAYDLASTIFERSLYSQPEPPPQSHQQAHDIFWSGFLLERAGRLDSALRDYQYCLKEAPNSSDDFYSFCSDGIVRISCVSKPASELCHASSGRAVSTSQIVTITTSVSGGGIAASVATSDAPPSLKKKESITLPIHLPIPDEMEELRNTVSPKELEKLNSDLKSQQLLIQPEAKEPR